jgi:hypothetical protein
MNENPSPNASAAGTAFGAADMGTDVSEVQVTVPEWGPFGQWQVDEIALAVSPIAFLSFVDIEFPPDERAHRFADDLAAALSAAGSRVRQKQVSQGAAVATGVELTVDMIPGPAQQAVAMALWNAGLRYRLHFENILARPLIKIGLRPDCPLPRMRAEIAPGWVSRAATPGRPPAAAVDQPHGPAPPPVRELMNLFRPLGDNCELGLVQRHAGAEPIDLLRFAGLHIPIEHRLRAITDGIAKGFTDLGGAGTLHFETFDPDDSGKQEFIAQENVYHLRYHTARYVGEIDPDRLLQQQLQVLQVWRSKFFEDLRAADKVCVWKSNLPQRESDIRDLLAVLRIYGPNTLLWVAQFDADHAAGTVDDLGRGLFKGYVTRFAPYDRAYEIALESWFAMCARAYRVIPALHGADQDGDQGRADEPANDASAYEGWVDGLMDGRVCGWCWRKGRPDPVSLELSIDGQRVATFVAADRRDDLEQAGIGTGRHGFFSPIALRGLPPEAVIAVKVAGTDIEIPGSGRRLSEYPVL